MYWYDKIQYKLGPLSKKKLWNYIDEFHFIKFYIHQNYDGFLLVQLYKLLMNYVKNDWIRQCVILLKSRMIDLGNKKNLPKSASYEIGIIFCEMLFA